MPFETHQQHILHTYLHEGTMNGASRRKWGTTYRIAHMDSSTILVLRLNENLNARKAPGIR